MGIKFTNTAISSLATAIDATATTCILNTGDGAKFLAPAAEEFQMLVLTNGVLAETVKMTARTSDTITVVRAEEGSALSWAAGTKVIGAFTQKAIDYLIADAGLQAGQIAIATLSGTSNSSITMGSVVSGGNVTFTTVEPSNSRAWIPNNSLVITSTTDSTKYITGMVVSYTGTTLVVNVEQFNGTGTISSWDINLSGLRGVRGVNWMGVWSGAAYYKVYDIVVKDGNTYFCKQDTTGAFEAVTNTAYWEIMATGIDWTGDWNSGTTYKINDAVSSGASTYICILGHTNQPVTNGTYWQVFTTGYQYAGTWNSGTTYSIYDIVRHGGRSYICILASTNNEPPNGTYWAVLSDGQQFLGEWSSTASYIVGDSVRYGANTYICKLAHTNQTPTNATYWDKATSGVKYTGTWSGATNYKVDDLVHYNGTSYICIEANINNTPPTTHWSTFAAAGGSDHGSLTGLADDDHSQYAMTNPAAVAVTYTAAGTTTVTLNGRDELFYTTAVTNTTTWAFSGAASTGKISGFVLELTNGGSQTQVWPTSVKWDSGVAPTLTTAGRDILAFYTRDGGTLWNGLLAAKDIK